MGVGLEVGVGVGALVGIALGVAVGVGVGLAETELSKLTCTVAPVEEIDSTLIVTPVSGSLSVLPTPQAASVKVTVAGVQSTSRVSGMPPVTRTVTPLTAAAAAPKLSKPNG